MKHTGAHTKTAMVSKQKMKTRRDPIFKVEKSFFISRSFVHGADIFPYWLFLAVANLLDVIHTLFYYVSPSGDGRWNCLWLNKGRCYESESSIY